MLIGRHLPPLHSAAGIFFCGRANNMQDIIAAALAAILAIVVGMQIGGDQ